MTARVPLGPEGFAKLTGVSRETLGRLQSYVELLTAWNRRINLVGRATIGDVWRRHILDSAQLFPSLPAKTRVLVDLGSGAGLPGLVLAILGVPEVHLIEADLRKCAFLREAARVSATAVRIHARRIETVPPFRSDVVTARALAPLDQLLELARPFMGEGTQCVFLKGEGVDEELRSLDARRLRVERRASQSDPSGTLLTLGAAP